MGVDTVSSGGSPTWITIGSDWLCSPPAETVRRAV